MRRLIAEHAPSVSAVSYVEVLGYHGLTDQEMRYFKEVFAAARVLGIDSTVLEQAVRLRQLRKMTLGDALVAGTPLAHSLTLVTRNTSDFRFSQTQLSQIREIQRTVVGKTSGSDADHLAGVLRGLAPLTCVLHSKQHTPFVRVKIKPYFERREASSQA